MKITNIGVIGLGRFSKLHLKCFKQMPHVKIKAVCDVNPEISAEIARELNCKAYTNWKVMLEAEALDAVDILTPEFAHEDPIRIALEAGLHVFVEKPLVLSSSTAANLIRLAEQQRKLLVTGHVCRFDTRYIQIKSKLQSGHFGALRSIYARRNNGQEFFHIYKRVNPIYILGIHDIDLMNWFTGQKVVEVYAQSPPNKEGEHDLVYAMLKYADGTIGVIENNWLLPSKAPAFMDVRMEVVGDEATVHLQEPDLSMVIWDNHYTQTPPLISGSEAYGRLMGPLYEELLHFIECVDANKVSDILLPKDAFAAVSIAEAAVRSLEEGRPVTPYSYEEILS